MWRVLDETCRRGVAEGAFPGAVVLVGNSRDVLIHRAYGCRALAPVRLPMTPDTVFDMSSLTKPMATTTAMMLLMRDGRVRLDDPVSTVIPEFGAGAKAAVTFRHLLNHTSGLPAWKPYHEPAEPTENPHGSGKRRCLDQLHDEVRSPVATRSAVEQARDVGVLQTGEDLTFGVKAMQNLRRLEA